MTILQILWMAPQGKGGDAGAAGMMNMVIMLGMVGVLYFFMIRPQVKKAKQQKEFANSIQTGDDIVTIAGIHGKIVRENEDGTILVDIGRNVQIKMERSAISMEMTQKIKA